MLLRASPVLRDHSRIPTHPSPSVRMLHLQFKWSKQELDFFQGDLRVWEAQNLYTEIPHTVACRKALAIDLVHMGHAVLYDSTIIQINLRCWPWHTILLCLLLKSALGSLEHLVFNKKIPFWSAKCVETNGTVLLLYSATSLLGV